MHFLNARERQPLPTTLTGGHAMGLLLFIILLVLLLGGLPTWGYSRNWGYGPSGLLGVLLLVLILLLVFQVVPWTYPGPVTHY
jgi:hypothetical protein